MPTTTIKIVIDPSGAQAGAKQANDALDSVKSKAQGAGSGVDQYIDRVKSNVVSIRGAVVLAGVAVATLTAAIAKSVSVNRAFESSISELSAITGATGDDLKFLSDQAKEFGRTTTKSATDAALAFKLVASAKPDLLENKEALAAVTKEAIILSEAAGIELPEAADALGASLNQFSEKADQANRFINVLAAGAKFGASEIAATAEALRDSGTVAASANISFEETNAAIQALASVSIKGSRAGVALRNVILRLQQQSENGLNPAVVGLSAALDNLAEKELKTTELIKIFGLENVTAASALIKQSDSISKLTEKLTGTNTAYEQAGTRVDNLDGTIKQLSSSIESVAIIIGEKFTPIIRTLATEFKNFIDGLTESERAQKIFQEQILTNKTIIEAYGFSLKSIDSTSLDDVNRTILAMKLNGVDLLKQAPYGKINEQILEHVFRVSELQISLDNVTKAYGENSVAAQKIGSALDFQKKKLDETIQKYIELDNAQNTSSGPISTSVNEDVIVNTDELLSTYSRLEDVIRNLSTETETASDSILAYNALWQGGIISVEKYEQAVRKAGQAFSTDSVKVLSEQEDLIRSMLSPLELYSDELLRLNALWQGNILSVEEYDRRVRLATENFRSSTDVGIQKSNEWAEAWESAGNRFAAGIGDAVADAIFEQQTLHDAMKSVIASVLRQVISTLVEIGVKKTALFILGEQQTAASTATQVASNSTIAASAAPAAAGTSLATFGANIGPALAAIAITYALAKSLSAREVGGEIKAGKSYLVGERGPEVITPTSAGYVTPNNKLFGGSNQIRVTQVFQLSAVDATGIDELLKRRRGFIHNEAVRAVRKAMRDNGVSPIL